MDKGNNAEMMLEKDLPLIVFLELPRQDKNITPQMPQQSRFTPFW
jgi:hypothetical protein